MKRMHRPLSRVGAAVLLAGALAGCNQYLDRRETVSFAAGDAMARNRAIHIIDPWPRESFRDHAPVAGRYLEAPMERYRTGAPAPAPTATAAPVSITR